MRTKSLLCIAIPRVSAIFFTFQGNRLSCTTELYQPQCQPAPNWPPKCNGYGFLVHVLSYRTLRFDSGESMRTIKQSKRDLLFMIFYLVQNSCVDIYTKLKLVHWTLDVHHSCSSLLSFTFKNNSLNFVQKKRKNIS